MHLLNIETVLTSDLLVCDCYTHTQYFFDKHEHPIGRFSLNIDTCLHRGSKFITTKSTMASALLKSLNQYANEKLVRSNCHPTLPLVIYNYTELCQYKKKWNPILLQARGLVIDHMGKVIGRPFPKFFNLGDSQAHNAIPPVPQPLPENLKEISHRIYTKLDGSLGIYFNYEGHWIMASRSSFTSEQALVATELANISNLPKKCDPKYTYVFEIIYPSNRIVVDYHEKKELVLLGVILNSSLEDGYEEITGDALLQTARHLGVECASDCTESFSGELTLDKLKKLNWKNREGFVVRFENGSRLKIKFEDYITSHSIRTGFKTELLTKWIVEGKDIESCLDLIPDEMHEQVNAVEKVLQAHVQEKIEKLTEHVLLFSCQKDFSFSQIVQQCSEQNMSKEEINLVCKHVKAFRLCNECTSHPCKGQHDTNKEAIRKDCARFVCKQEDLMNSLHTLMPIKTWNNKSQPLPQTANPIITVLVGVSGCGKTFFSRHYVRHHKGKTLRISRDDLRDQYGQQGSRLTEDQESYISTIFNMLVEKALSSGHHVIMDNTHLKKKYIQQIRDRYAGKYSITFKTFDTPFEICMERIKSRPNNQVSKKVLKKQWEDFQILLSQDILQPSVSPNENFVNLQKEAIISQNQSQLRNKNGRLTVSPPTRTFRDNLPFVYIFDMDSTLALMQERNPFDESRVLDDISNPDVLHLCQTLNIKEQHTNQSMNIIICSGRTEACRQDTLEWLNDRDIIPLKLYLRPINDFRRDEIIKNEMWQDIIKHYNIRLMVDDRNRVVQRGRTEGFTVLQVRDGDF